jgi:hypothetical protein
MILNALFCLFIFITSFGFLCHEFIIYRTDCHKQFTQFIDQNKKDRRKFNEKGFGTLLGISLTFVLSLIFYLYLGMLKIENREIFERTETYLCFKELNDSTKNYISKVGLINKSILIAQGAKLSGVLTPEAQASIDTLKILRGIIHLKYIKSLSITKHCSLKQSSSFLTHLPYETTTPLVLVSGADETTIVKDHEWTLNIFCNPIGLRKTHLYFLKIHYHLLSQLDSTLKVQLEEMGSQALLN